jgi:hypothetical protein
MEGACSEQGAVATVGGWVGGWGVAAVAGCSEGGGVGFSSRRSLRANSYSRQGTRGARVSNPAGAYRKWSDGPGLDGPDQCERPACQEPDQWDHHDGKQALQLGMAACRASKPQQSDARPPCLPACGTRAGRPYTPIRTRHSCG